jgi:hypothetical protein
MRYFRNRDLEESHRSTLERHPHTKEAVQEQIERSRAQVAASETLLRRPAVDGTGLPAIPTADDCRRFAAAFRCKAAEAGTPARTASVMTSISRSFSGLATQLAMLEAS